MNITGSKHWPRIKSMIPKHFFNILLILYYKVNALLYYGNKVYCPVCDAKYRRFRSHNTCPGCGAGKRHKVLWLFLQRKTNYFKDELHVLHFSPEHCFFYKMKNMKNLDYVTADLNSPRAMVKVDMSDIRYPDNHFDVLISSHVLEHVKNDIKAMNELYRVQKKDGWSIHLVPIDYFKKETFADQSVNAPEDRLRLYGHYDHKRLYGTDFKNRLGSAGFNVEIFKTEDFCQESEINKMGIKKGFEIYYCTKK
jgi:SAM-dependent methyltransferase